MSQAAGVAAVRKTYMPDVIPGTVGHAVLASGAATIAVWQASATGQPTGARVVARAAPARDLSLAAELLGLTDRRVLVAWNTAAAMAVIDELALVAGLPRPRIVAVDLPTLADELGDARRRTGGLAGWRDALRAASPHELARALGLAPLAFDDEAAETALLTVRVLARLAAMWRAGAGRGPRAAGPLPGRWLAALRAAAGDLGIPDARQAAQFRTAPG